MAEKPTKKLRLLKDVVRTLKIKAAVRTGHPSEHVCSDPLTSSKFGGCEPV